MLYLAMMFTTVSWQIVELCELCTVRSHTTDELSRFCFKACIVYRYLLRYTLRPVGWNVSVENVSQAPKSLRNVTSRNKRSQT